MTSGRWLAVLALLALACGGAPPAPRETCASACMRDCLGPYGLTDYGPCRAACASRCREPSAPVVP